MTQVIEPSTFQTAFPELTDPKPKSTVSPSLSIPTDHQRNRSRSELQSKKTSLDENESRASPYEKFEAKTLVRHPSLTRQQSKQLSPVKESPPRGSLQHAVSSPALQKLLSEDNEFSEDLRRRSELKDDGNQRKRHLRKLQPSIELRKSIERDLSSQDVIIPGRPTDSPKPQKKLGLTGDLDDFTGSASTTKGLVPVSVDIDIGDESHGLHDETVAANEVASKVTEEVKPKKKKYVLKKKKVKKLAEPAILEDEKEHVMLEDKGTEHERDKKVLSDKEMVSDEKLEEDSLKEEGSTVEERGTVAVPNVYVGEDRKPCEADVKHEASTTEESTAGEAEKSPARVMTKEEKKKEKESKKFKLKKKTKEKKEKKSEKKIEKKEKKEKKKKKQDEDSDWVVIDIKGNVIIIQCNVIFIKDKGVKR